jgi:DNA-binding GntR family transcriptional regulator
MTQRYRRLAERLGINTTLHKLRHYSATDERAKSDPRAPFEDIAAKIRREILDGKLTLGSLAPTQKAIARDHQVSLGTANRAVELLTAWGLVDTSRGRAVILKPSADEARPRHYDVESDI